ncbi:hypothetical protein ACNS7O_04210 [Haloferacaceae archaeon DSL9]
MASPDASIDVDLSQGSKTKDTAYNRLVRWLLIDGDRLFISACTLAVWYLLFVGLNSLGVVGFLNDDSITRMAGGMIAGTFTVVTIVISINQLILSRQFAAAGEFQDRYDDVMAMRTETEKQAGVPVSPAAPTTYLELVVGTIEVRARSLSDTVAEHDAGAADALGDFATTVAEDAEPVRETLADANFEAVEAVSAAIAFDDSAHLYAERYLSNVHGSNLSPETNVALDELREALQLFNVARSHFKTTYLQRELSHLSRLVTLTGVPSVVAAMCIGLLYATPTGPAITSAALPYVTAALMIVVLAPLTIVSTYVLRSATLTRMTASIGPFVAERDPDDMSIEIDADGSAAD